MWKRFCRACVPRWLRSRNWLQVVLLLLAVLVGGAAVLVQLEAPNERVQAREYAAVLRRLDELVDEGRLNRSEVATLRRFAEQTAVAPQFETMTDGDGDDDDQYSPNWSAVGAVWFMFTLVSTIGYGNYTPQTDAGRMAVVVLGTIGIPLFGYLMLLVGRELNDCVHRGQVRTLCKCCQRRPRHDDLSQVALLDPEKQRSFAHSTWSRVIHASILLAALGVGTVVTHTMRVFRIANVDEDGDDQYTLGNVLDEEDAVHMSKDIVNALYFCFASATTVGFGDFAPRVDQPWRLASLTIWLVSRAYALRATFLL